MLRASSMPSARCRSRVISFSYQAAATCPSGSPTASRSISRPHPRVSSVSQAFCSSLRAPYSGSAVRPRWPVCSRWTRLRTSSTTRFAKSRHVEVVHYAPRNLAAGTATARPTKSRCCGPIHH